MKDLLRTVFRSTLDALSLDRVIREKVRCRDGVLSAGGESLRLDEFRKVLVVAIGKAAHPMAEAFAAIVQPKQVSGVIVTSVPDQTPPPYFLRYVGGHPYPNRQSARAAAVVSEMLDDLKPHHLVVYLLSGGGSAIFERPINDEITLADSRQLFEALVTCGADIVKMNTLRKHLSAVKGGRLAELAYPARQLTLYVSDVPVDQPSSIASGPTMPDPSTVDDCYRLADELAILDRLPQSIRSLFDARRLPETPKPGAAAFSNSAWVSLLDNSHAIAAVEAQAARRGWILETDLSVDDRPVAEAADRLLARLRRLRDAHPGKTVAVVTGGELSSPVSGPGMGGRNQAFVLDCVPKIAGQQIAVVSAGTDGIDGNSPAAGALADGDTLARAEALGLDQADYFAASDSFHYFEKLDDLLLTGPTGNNVRDIRLLLAW